jgi:hypothetical protein
VLTLKDEESNVKDRVVAVGVAHVPIEEGKLAVLKVVVENAEVPLKAT